MMKRNEILEKIQALHIERGERLGDMASHSLDLSDEYERVGKRLNQEIRTLQKLLE